MSWAQVSRETLGPVSSVVSVILVPVISLTSHLFIPVRVIIWMHIRSVFVSLGVVSHQFWLDRIPSIRTPSLRCERTTVVTSRGVTSVIVLHMRRNIWIGSGFWVVSCSGRVLCISISGVSVWLGTPVVFWISPLGSGVALIARVTFRSWRSHGY